MKLLSTTPVSRSRRRMIVKPLIIAVVVLVATVIPMRVFQPQAAYADEYDDKIAALQKQVDAYNEEAAKLAKEADTLQRQLSILTNQKAAIQARIDANQATYDKLQRDIAESERKIAMGKDVLGETLANMAVDDKITPLEMLASSSNIADFIDKQEQRATVRDTLSRTIDEIKATKAKLEVDKAAVEKVLDDQKAQRQILAGKEAQQSQLLAQTRGSEAKYQSMISDKNSQIEDLRREAAVVRAALANANGVTGGSASNVSGYPFYPNGCGFINDGYGYYRCQCVSYVAYRLAADSRNTNFAYLGNAEDWWDDGVAVGAGDIQRGDVIVWLVGSPGHVMFVESVSGGLVYYTDFNGAGGPLSPGQGTVSVSQAVSYPMKVIRFR